MKLIDASRLKGYLEEEVRGKVYDVDSKSYVPYLLKKDVFDIIDLMAKTPEEVNAVRGSSDR